MPPRYAMVMVDDDGLAVASEVHARMASAVMDSPSLIGEPVLTCNHTAAVNAADAVREIFLREAT